MSVNSPEKKIACDLNLAQTSVEMAIKLLEQGFSVPYIAHYERDATAGLTKTSLRAIESKWHALKTFNQRKKSIKEALAELELLTDDWSQAIDEADSRLKLEDIHWHLKPKKHEASLAAKKAGLQPLADAMLMQCSKSYQTLALEYIQADTEYHDLDTVLAGVSTILAEIFSEDIDVLEEIRRTLWNHGVLKVISKPSKATSTPKHQTQINDEPIKKISCQRVHALFRERREGRLELNLVHANAPDFAIDIMQKRFINANHTGDTKDWLIAIMTRVWQTKLKQKCQLEILNELKEQADDKAIAHYIQNFKHTLLKKPVTSEVIMGIVPQKRSGMSIAIIDKKGELLDSFNVHIMPSQNTWQDSLASVVKSIIKFNVSFVSIAHQAGYKDAIQLIRALVNSYSDIHIQWTLTSHLGATSFASSEYAKKLYPEVDASVIEAMTCAYRLQHPLKAYINMIASLNQAEPMLQDVNPIKLTHALKNALIDCVNSAGIDVNDALVSLLQYVSGLNEERAHNIVCYIQEHGLFESRETLKQVPLIDEATYQQCIGFLRIYNALNPLDATNIHPENYPLVSNILHSLEMSLDDLKSAPHKIKQLDISSFVDTTYGVLTVKSVLNELKRLVSVKHAPLSQAQFNPKIQSIHDLKHGMILEGIVSHVTYFGAFVEIGISQDALIHNSEMKPVGTNHQRLVIRPYDIVRVRVIDVDTERQRIGVTMKLDETPTKKSHAPKKQAAQKTFLNKGTKPVKKPQATTPKPLFNTAMADALIKLKKES